MRPLALFAIVAAASFVGVSGALLVHQMLVPAEPHRSAELPSENVAADPSLSEAMGELARELRETRSVLSTLAGPASQPSQRTAVTESGDNALAELAAAVRDLRGALPLGIGGSAPHLPVLVPPQDDRRGWLAPLPAGIADPERAYTRQHLFWTEQQILERYGAPDEINVDASTRAVWRYYDPDPNAERGFYVVIFQGRVIGVGT